MRYCQGYWETSCGACSRALAKVSGANLRNHAGLEVQMKTLGAPVPFGWPPSSRDKSRARGQVQHGLQMIPRAHLSRRDVLSSPPRHTSLDWPSRTPTC